MLMTSLNGKAASLTIHISCVLLLAREVTYVDKRTSGQK